MASVPVSSGVSIDHTKIIYFFFFFTAYLARSCFWGSFIQGSVSRWLGIILSIKRSQHVSLSSPFETFLLLVDLPMMLVGNGALLFAIVLFSNGTCRVILNGRFFCCLLGNRKEQ
jgi:hypothetical protein